ncbi:MAG: 3-nucleotidase / 5-nucleotidase / exopolyphosphatase [Thermoleophilia bacterium]|nr:3-nucleotidase / 5-nucleotidase / exopolyphosphatase [Thermoleophilia bacterium]MCZ4496118.1 3-nucleotidase / 5-nucleotidase / exopolyphosphatase [Thermoleophilia bacterium]
MNDAQNSTTRADDRPTILVTNDDGIESLGLRAVVEALAPLGRITVIAPDRNRSGVSRSITLGQMLQVVEHEIEHAEVAFATDGTPTDCVRLAILGLAGTPPDLVVSGANLGLNVGDDVAYSGTVSAAFDAAMNGIPAVAISQQSLLREMGYPRHADFDYRAMQAFIPGLVREVWERRAEHPSGLVVNVNVPGCQSSEIPGVEIGGLGRRIYRDKLERRPDVDGRRRYDLYGDDPEHHADEVGTDIAAIGRGNIAVTPLRFNAHDPAEIAALSTWGLSVVNPG